MPGTWKKRGNSITIVTSAGFDANGKQIRYNKTLPYVSDKQAEKETSLFYSECMKGQVQKGSDITVGDLCNLFMKDNIYLKPSTRDAYQSIIENHISKIASSKASKLNKVAIQRWINDMAGISPKTIRNIYAFLSTVMKWAVTMDYTSANPCQNIRLPKKTHHEAKHYTEEQVRSLLLTMDMLPPEELRYKVALCIALFGGLRKGEILGLNWSDYDGRSIRIQRTRLIGRTTGVYETTPKTDGSHRLVTLPPEICAYIDALRLQQAEQRLALGDQWQESEAMIKGDFGAPLYPQVLQRWFTRFIEKNNLPPLTLHGLRHTHTSMLAAMQIDLKQISQRLGHTQASTTMNIYMHLFRTDDGIADELSRQFLN